MYNEYPERIYVDRGIDASTAALLNKDNNMNDMWPWMAMMNGGMGGFGGGGWWIWILFLLWGRNGWGGFGGEGGGLGLAGTGFQDRLSTIQETLQDNHNTDLLMSAIKGNDNAIHELATTLNCDFGQLNNSICAIQGAIKEVGGKVGFSAERVINAVNAGDCNVIQAIKDCCCNTQQSILKMGYENQIATLNQTNTLQTAIAGVNTGLERGFSSLAYETQKQTCDLENAIKDSTAQILAGQRAAEMREMQNKIDALQDERQTYKLGNMMAQYSAPANNALADLSARLAKIECNQPEVAKIPYVPAAGNYVPVNYSIPMHFGYGAGYSSCNYGC